MTRAIVILLTLVFATCTESSPADSNIGDVLEGTSDCPGMPITLPGTSTVFTLEPPAPASCGLELSGAAALPSGGWLLAGRAEQGNSPRAALIEIDRQGQPGRSWLGGPEPTTFVADPVILEDGSVAILCQGGTPSGSWLARVDLGGASNATVLWSVLEPALGSWSLLLSSENELWSAFSPTQASQPPLPGLLRRYAVLDGSTNGSTSLDPQPAGIGLLKDLNGNAVYSPQGALAFDVRAVGLSGAEKWRHSEDSGFVADLARGPTGEIWAVGMIGAGAVEYQAWKVTRFAPDGTIAWTKDDLPQACHQIPNDANPGYFFSANFVVPAPDGGALVGIHGEADDEPVPRTVRFDSSGDVLWQVATVPMTFAHIAVEDRAILFEQADGPGTCEATVRIFEVPFDAL